MGLMDETYDTEAFNRLDDVIAADEANIGELEVKEHDICDNCPLVGFPQDEVRGSLNSIVSSVNYPGVTVVTLSQVSENGKSSKEMILGTHPGDSIGGKRIKKIAYDAAERTQSCQGPRRAPGLLGLVGVRRCNALEEYKTGY